MKQDNNSAPRVLTWACYVVVGAGILVGIWLIFTYGLGLVAPFLVAWLLSRLIRPLVSRMVGKSRMPRGLAAGVLVFLFVAGFLGLLAWGVSRGVSELSKLMEGLSQEGSPMGNFFTQAQDFLGSASSHIPFLKGLSEHPHFADFCARLDELVRQGAEQMLTTMGQGLPAMVMSVLGSIPSVLIFMTSLLFSCYYFSADDGSLWQGFLSCLSPPWRRRVDAWKDSLGAAAKKYVRAYLVLGLITFLEMFLGLSVLGVPYAFLLAWGIALIDFLPLLGTGVVLVPWAVVMFVMGDVHMGLGLLILFGVSSLVRQFAEPKLLSAELGLHPLVSLFAVFAGWQLFGVWGMMIAPFVALLVKALVRRREG